MTELPSKAAFADNLETTFRLSRSPGDVVPLTLIELREGAGSPLLEQFALLFRGPNEKPFDQGLYEMKQETLGSFTLFLVPVGADGCGRYYEAVFNRFIGSTGVRKGGN